MALEMKGPGGTRELSTCFVIGAPRCGTTFLSKLLSRHPQVCFSQPKETYYFPRLADGAPLETVRREFLARHAPQLCDGHRVLVEGTPVHLYSQELLERLLAFDPETRFVVSVRSPVEMAPSVHGRLLYTLDEDVRDFEKAWSLQEARARGERMPPHCREPLFLQYEAICRLGEHVERLYKTIGRERCHIVVFDDIARDPAGLYRGLQRFLELDEEPLPDLRSVNRHKEFRHRWVQRLIANPPAPLLRLFGTWERQGRPQPEWLRGLRRRLKRWNTRPTQRPPLSPAMRDQLCRLFATDVDRLGELLGRDLGHWLR